MEPRQQSDSYPSPAMSPSANVGNRTEDQRAMHVSDQTTGVSCVQVVDVDEPELPFGCTGLTGIPLSVARGPRAIEDEDFPFEAFSEIAEIESWRKEINRPLYYIHKWWAHRLGTVFRAMVIGVFASKSSNLLYKLLRIANAIVFDPFMGSGATVGEAAKLSVRTIGHDINPVTYFPVKNALLVNRKEILREFRAVEHDVADRICQFYRALLPDGTQVDVLYFFWVNTINCPECRKGGDLFSLYVFARSADPKKHPEAQAVCRNCSAIRQVRYDASDTRHACCKRAFDLQAGPANGRNATCLSYLHSFATAEVVQKGGRAPSYRLYAKSVLALNGKKPISPPPTRIAGFTPMLRWRGPRRFSDCPDRARLQYPSGAWRQRCY